MLRRAGSRSLDNVAVSTGGGETCRSRTGAKHRFRLVFRLSAGYPPDGRQDRRRPDSPRVELRRSAVARVPSPDASYLPTLG
jgi:hypothetical protein